MACAPLCGRPTLAHELSRHAVPVGLKLSSNFKERAASRVKIGDRALCRVAYAAPRQRRKCRDNPSRSRLLSAPGRRCDARLMFYWSGHILHFEATGPWHPPEFAGSMVRGALGSALKRLVCVMRLQDCTGCPLEFACVYTSIFETRPMPGAGVMTRYDRAPHPFVLVVGLDEPAEAGRLTVGLRLFGEATRAAPFALRALEEAAARGLGASRTPFRLVAAGPEGEEAKPWAGGAWRPGPIRGAPTPWAERTALRFATPLRLKREGRLVTPEALTGGDIVMTLVRRIGLLAAFFGRDAVRLDFPALKAAAARAKLVEPQIAWRDLFRRSSRQNARLGIGGLVGAATLDLGADETLRELMAWAPVLHVGKGASMGLGRIEAVAA